MKIQYIISNWKGLLVSCFPISVLLIWFYIFSNCLFFVIQEMEVLKEPDFFVYEDRDYNSVVTGKPSDSNLAESADRVKGKLKRIVGFFFVIVLL